MDCTSVTILCEQVIDVQVTLICECQYILKASLVELKVNYCFCQMRFSRVSHFNFIDKLLLFRGQVDLDH